MPSRTLATLSIIAAGVLAPAAVADAASKKASQYPTIKKISPMSVSIGETMTISGSGFLKGKGKNTVVFRRAGKQAIFVKADGLSTKRLSLVVPEKLRTSLGKKSGRVVATRFQVRVLAKRFGKGYTKLRSSPMVLPEETPAAAGGKKAAPAPAPQAPAAPITVARNDPPPPPAPNCDGDGQMDNVDADDDNDLLSDSIEASLSTNRCLADTDGDGMSDGWEYQSAYDLNEPSCPAGSGTDVYPIICSAVRPFPADMNYPNPLWDDGDSDYDGDWIPAAEEHRAWDRKAKADASKRTLTNMWYSGGKQSSVNDDPNDGCVGMTITPAMMLFGDPAYSPDGGLGRSRTAGDGCLSDDERDEDGDFLPNHIELDGETSGPDWWAGNYEDEPGYRSAYAGTKWLDADTDNDQVVDGIDDQDYDDFWNIEEIERGAKSFSASTDTTVRTGLWVQPFNPCLPAVNSRTCSKYIPLGGGAWMPFLGQGDTAPTERWPLWGDPARLAPSDAGSVTTGFWNSDGADATLPLSGAQRLPLRPRDGDGTNDLAPTVEHPIPIPR